VDPSEDYDKLPISELVSRSAKREIIASRDSQTQKAMLVRLSTVQLFNEILSKFPILEAKTKSENLELVIMIDAIVKELKQELTNLMRTIDSFEQDSQLAVSKPPQRREIRLRNPIKPMKISTLTTGVARELKLPPKQKGKIRTQLLPSPIATPKENPLQKISLSAPGEGSFVRRVKRGKIRLPPKREDSNAMFFSYPPPTDPNTEVMHRSHMIKSPRQGTTPTTDPTELIDAILIKLSLYLQQLRDKSPREVIFVARTIANVCKEMETDGNGPEPYVQEQEDVTRNLTTSEMMTKILALQKATTKAIFKAQETVYQYKEEIRFSKTYSATTLRVLHKVKEHLRI